MRSDIWVAFNLGLMVGGWGMIIAMRLFLPGMLKRRGLVSVNKARDEE